MKAITALKALATAINTVADGFGEAVVLSEADGFEEPTLCFEGLYDWTMCLGGASLFAGELGDYSRPTEKPIQKVLDMVDKENIFFEPINGYQVAAIVD